MADMTVAQFAQSMSMGVEQLVEQLAAAGVRAKRSQDQVTEEEKKKLLSYLKVKHGQSSNATPNKVTLTRKTTQTLSVTPNSTGGKGGRTVDVEVRKKRTYVKREDEVVLPTPATVPVTEAPTVAPAPVVEKVEKTVPAVEAPRVNVMPTEKIAPADLKKPLLKWKLPQRLHA